ncbi:MAG: FAD-dependent oxidoreductase [Flavobacteriales bacterium]|nr:FAD-dependent oxidoreductase [Flavobacteriales bacterium]
MPGKNQTTPRILVIGDGLAGTLITRELHRRGVSFVQWGNGSPGASDVAAGMFNPVSFRRILPVWDARQHVEEAKACYTELEKELNQTFWRVTPLLRIFPDVAYADAWDDRIAQRHPVSEFIERCTPGDWHASVEAPHGAGRIREAGWVDVQLLIESSRAAWKSSEQWEKRTWEFKDGCPNGFDRVIDCRGVGAVQDLKRFGLEVRPNHGEVITVRPTEDLGSETVNNATWAMPLGDGSLRVGSTYRWDVVDSTTFASSADELVEKVNLARTGEPFRKDHIEQHLGGLRPASPDRRPLVGPLSYDDPWYVVCNGWGTRGVLIGPRTARWVVESALNPDFQVPDEVRPQRFRSFTKN